ncbi:MAG: DUF1648 domain-containing protein [Dehalococcoidales bacterium]|nr:DUF1648 domain-containing protein [Dehalococcoidales bacterium]
METSERNPDDKSETVELTFRRKYILLPLAILLLMAVLTAIFYPQLTNEVAYRFNLNGSPESWLSRQVILLFALLPQLILFIIAIAITWGITRAGRSIGQISSALKPERFLMLMGNIVALPQIIFGFVMLDVFIYNVYGNHLMPMWLFALIIMIIGSIILAVFFIQAFNRSRSLNS